MNPAMCMVVSEQLAPNLEAIGHFMRGGRTLRALRLFHTDDRQRSLLPALRLLQLVRRIFPSLDTRRVQISSEPAAVLAQLSAEMDAAPGPWIVNASGGLKSMTFGIAPLLQRADVSVIYSEIGKGWLRILPNLSTERLDIAPDSDWLPVEDFIRCQDQEHSDFRLHSTPAVEFRLSAGATLAGVLRRAAKSGWRWNNVAELAPATMQGGGRPPSDAGFFFERFVAATLLSFGIHNFIGGVKATAHNGTPLEECDFCVLHKGRLVHIDCSIARPGGTKGSYVTQINDALARAAILGGRDAQAVLIRPTPKHPRPEVIQLAVAKKVVFIGADDWLEPSSTGGFFAKLAAVFGIKSLLRETRLAAKELDDYIAWHRRHA